MTNAPPGRTTHVVRLVGTNSAGDVLQDIWVDVERIDQFSVRTQTSLPQFNIENQYQEVVIKLKWRDDPNGDNYIAEDDLSGDANTGRVHELIKVCDPENTDDFANPGQWVSVKTIVHIDMDQQGIGTSQKRFVAKALDADRKVNPRRIFHYDTSIDDTAQSAFDGDHSLKAYVAKGNDYKRDDSTKDDGQYVEHEIIERLEKHINAEAWSSGGDNQGVQFRLKNQYLIDESDKAKLDKLGPNNRNPPYRLDPFQNIINVKFGATVIVAFVDLCFEKSSFAPASGVEFLDSREMHFVNADATDGFCTLYKVKSSAKDFMTVTTPAASDDVYVYIFALDGGDLSGSVERAFSGATHAQYATFLESHDPLETELTTPVISPPGMLWSVGLPRLPAGDARDWKIRFGAHRTSPGPPANSMLQVYPLGGSYDVAGGEVTYSGYQIRMYRLDPKGTGDAYGASDIGADTGAFSGMRMDTAWHQVIAGGDNIDYGIPFGDPPPLVSSDVVHNN